MPRPHCARPPGATVIASSVEAPLVENPKKVGTSPLPLPDACPVDYPVDDGDVVQIGNMAWKVLLTPGHSKGGMCWYMVPQFGNHADGAPVLVSGDTLFAGTTGRTDFEGGSVEDMQASMIRLALLPDETIVLPGHNGLTTIGAERRRTFALWGNRGIRSPFRQLRIASSDISAEGRARASSACGLGEGPLGCVWPDFTEILRQVSAFRVKRPCSAHSLVKNALN